MLTVVARMLVVSQKFHNFGQTVINLAVYLRQLCRVVCMLGCTVAVIVSVNEWAAQ